VAAALTAIHASPARAWSIATLAHEVGTSRSVLAERFTRLVGDPPMQYVARWGCTSLRTSC
jgi:AraC-like DNA-binding protein